MKSSLFTFQMNEIVEASQRSTLDLQVQIDEYKEKNRKEMTDLQRQLRDKSAELEKSRLATKKLQDEVRVHGSDQLFNLQPGGMKACLIQGICGEIPIV